MAKKSSNLPLKKITSEVLKIAKNSGRILLNHQKKISKLKITYKDAQGVTSSADLASEAFIIKSLRKLMPDSHFMAEEDFHKQKQKDFEAIKKLDYCWVIDPLDGTHNFLNGSDYFSVCISLVKEGRPIMGVVYRPSTAECFFSYENCRSIYVDEKGKKSRIRLRKRDKMLSESLLVTGFATEKGEMFDREFQLFKIMMGHCRGVRRFGSAALDICYVSLGIWDGFWERGLAPWDVSAAGLIAQNTGLIVSNYQGKNFDPFDSSFLVASKHIHDQMLQHLRF